MSGLSTGFNVPELEQWQKGDRVTNRVQLNQPIDAINRMTRPLRSPTQLVRAGGGTAGVQGRWGTVINTEHPSGFLIVQQYKYDANQALQPVVWEGAPDPDPMPGGLPTGQFMAVPIGNLERSAYENAEEIFSPVLNFGDGAWVVLLVGDSIDPVNQPLCPP